MGNTKKQKQNKTTKQKHKQNTKTNQPKKKPIPRYILLFFLSDFF